MQCRYIVSPKYDNLTDFVQKIPKEFDHDGVLVYDKRNQVRIFEEKGEKLVVKRFHRPYIFQRFDYTFIRSSKAKRAYTFALRLQKLGISTPDPVACIEVYAWGLFRDGYLVTTFCGDPDARILREEWEEHDDLFDAIAHFLVGMHEKGFLHGDTNLSNFLYHQDPDAPGGYHITTIDINRSHFVEHPSMEECLKSMVRLTHVRPALQKLVGRYAELRGWNQQESVEIVMGMLDHFERKKELKHKMVKSK